MGLTRAGVARLAALLRPHPPLARGETLYRAGDLFECVFAVRTGALKSCTACDDGSGAVSCFHLAGELAGVDSIHGRHYATSTVALRRSRVCGFDFRELETLAGEIPALQQRLFRLISREIGCNRERVRMLGLAGAEARLARLLLRVEQRTHGPVTRGQGFTFPMSRADVSSYLAVPSAELDEAYRRFQREEWIRLHAAQVRITRYAPLQEMAELG